ncbi:cysteine hydrolase family protein [Nitratifractor sp.]
MIVIDLQNDYYPGGEMELKGIEAAHHKALGLIRLAADAGKPIFFIRHIAPQGAPFFAEGSKGSELHPELPLEVGEVIVKCHPNSFRDTPLQKRLEALGARRLAVCGAMSHMCIDTTVRAGYDLGYAITLAHDACATKDLEFGGKCLPAGEVHAAFMAALDGKFATVCDAGSLDASEV